MDTSALKSWCELARLRRLDRRQVRQAAWIARNLPGTEVVVGRSGLPPVCQPAGLGPALEGIQAGTGWDRQRVLSGLQSALVSGAGGGCETPSHGDGWVISHESIYRFIHAQIVRNRITVGATTCSRASGNVDRRSASFIRVPPVLLTVTPGHWEAGCCSTTGRRYSPARYPGADCHPAAWGRRRTRWPLP